MKFELNAAAQFTGNIVLPRGCSANLDANRASSLIVGLQAEYTRAIDQRLGPGGVVTEFGSSSLDGLQGFFLSDERGDADVDKGLRPISTEIADGANVSIGESHESATWIANNRAAQGKMFDATDGVGHVDGISHDILIFKDNVEAGDDVADQILRAESDGEAGEPGKSGNRSDIDAELLGSSEERDGPDNFAAGTENNACQSARLLLASLGRARLRGRGLDHQIGDDT